MKGKKIRIVKRNPLKEVVKAQEKNCFDVLSDRYNEDPFRQAHCALVKGG